VDRIIVRGGDSSGVTGGAANETSDIIWTSVANRRYAYMTSHSEKCPPVDQVIYLRSLIASAQVDGPRSQGFA
jgi:hypothetical protein